MMDTVAGRIVFQPAGFRPKRSLCAGQRVIGMGLGSNRKKAGCGRLLKRLDKENKINYCIMEIRQ